MYCLCYARYMIKATTIVPLKHMTLMIRPLAVLILHLLRTMRKNKQIQNSGIQVCTMKYIVLYVFSKDPFKRKGGHTVKFKQWELKTYIGIVCLTHAPILMARTPIILVLEFLQGVSSTVPTLPLACTCNFINSNCILSLKLSNF